ncbi:MAG: helix-turn-helix transcriptional regulator [Woeseiaceae bacterium]|nr:helix-turn-helix transcriptional regulator [Woeseiaceae bacterium]
MSEAFGALLRSWRGQRRMSQLELGLAANVSARHISFLETGRARPSKSMVLILSETLRVPRAIRNTLLNAAGFAKAYKSRDLGEDEMAYVRAAMDWTLERHSPFPAIAFDRHWRLVRSNGTAAALLEPMNLGEGDSLLDAFAEGGGIANAIVNWEEVARHMIARLRTESAHLGGDAVLEAGADRLAEQLGREKSEYTGTMPAVVAAKYNAGGMTLSFFSTISQFGSAEDIALADLKIELMFPADDFTREALVSQFGQEPACSTNSNVIR